MYPVGTAVNRASRATPCVPCDMSPSEHLCRPDGAIARHNRRTQMPAQPHDQRTRIDTPLTCVGYTSAIPAHPGSIRERVGHDHLVRRWKHSLTHAIRRQMQSRARLHKTKPKVKAKGNKSDGTGAATDEDSVVAQGRTRAETGTGQDPTESQGQQERRNRGGNIPPSVAAQGRSRAKPTRNAHGHTNTVGRCTRRTPTTSETSFPSSEGTSKQSPSAGQKSVMPRAPGKSQGRCTSARNQECSPLSWTP